MKISSLILGLDVGIIIMIIIAQLNGWLINWPFVIFVLLLCSGSAFYLIRRNKEK